MPQKKKKATSHALVTPNANSIKLEEKTKKAVKSISKACYQVEEALATKEGRLILTALNEALKADNTGEGIKSISAVVGALNNRLGHPIEFNLNISIPVSIRGWWSTKDGVLFSSDGGSEVSKIEARIAEALENTISTFTDNLHDGKSKAFPHWEEISCGWKTTFEGKDVASEFKLSEYYESGDEEVDEEDL